LDPGSSPDATIGDPDKKNPALRRDFPALAPFKPELAAALALLIRLLALTVGILLAVRILLLLAGLLAAALLLTGLLTRGLVLLARILIWVGHRDLPG
jgi:hypothetical protein